MKATGIVRRIDDLGRIVIPKEIRRTMRIREGDPLEIYTDREGGVIFRKYSPLGGIGPFAAEYAAALNKSCGLKVLITDRDGVIAGAGLPRREYADKRLSEGMEQILSSRVLFTADQTPVGAIEGEENHLISCAMPIVSAGDVTGAVVSLYEKGGSRPARESEEKLITTAAVFLGKQIEG